jgi:hypothetical protein
MSEDKIIGRISRSLAEGEILDGLARRLLPSDLQSLMLHVYRRRSAERSPAELVAQYERSAMVRPSTADPRALVEIERIAFEAAAGFEAVDLAPVAPLGLNRVLGRIHQNNCLATVRNAEVMADPTTAKALECARRRRAGEKETIKLCSRSRQLRLQPFDSPAFSPHFDLFSMVTAGRDRGGLRFEIESLREHIAIYLELLNRLATVGFGFEEITVNVSDTARDAARLCRAEEEILEPLARDWRDVTFRLDHEREQGRSYYSGLCLGLYATDATGLRFNLGDGGFTDWSQRLLSNAKERLLASAVGIELFAKRFLKRAE